MEILKGVSIGMPIGAIISFIAIWRTNFKISTNEGYQPKDDIGPDKVKSPEGAESVMQEINENI